MVLLLETNIDVHKRKCSSVWHMDSDTQSTVRLSSWCSWLWLGINYDWQSIARRCGTKLHGLAALLNRSDFLIALVIGSQRQARQPSAYHSQPITASLSMQICVGEGHGTCGGCWAVLVGRDQQHYASSRHAIYIAPIDVIRHTSVRNQSPHQRVDPHTEEYKSKKLESIQLSILKRLFLE